jgi:PilZ domain-containing protein
MEERRDSARLRMLKSGKILLGKAAVPCTVRNLSEGGACLQLQSTYGLPSAFDFALDDKPPRHCKVVWLDATTVRVEFQ